MTETLTKSQLLWRCRRGMLELDLMLEPFCNNCYDGLDLQLQQGFVELLENNDQKLYQMLLQREPAANELEAQLITMIRDYAQSSS